MKACARLDPRRVRPESCARVPSLSRLAAAGLEALGAILPGARPEGVTPDEWLRAELGVRDLVARATALEDLYLADAGVPLRFRELAVREELVPGELLVWATMFPASLARGGGALLCGPIGAGKTSAASFLVREAYRRGRVRDPLEASRAWAAPDAFFVDALDLADAAHDRGDSPVLRRARSAALLVVDDWRDDLPGLVRVERLLAGRWAATLPSVVTTTEPRCDFAGKWPDTYSRLCDASARTPGAVEVLRPDLRLSPPGGG